MPRIPLTVYPAARGGTVITPVTPQITGSGGNSFLNDGDTVLYIKNGHASTPCNMSIARVRTVDGVAPAARVVAVAALTEQIIGNLAPSDFNQTDGTVWIDPDFVTTVTVCVYQP